LRDQASGNQTVRVQILDAEADYIIQKLQSIPIISSVDFIRDEKNTFLISSNSDKSIRRDIFEICVKNNWFLSEMTPIETKLEDIFRELTMN